jgi:hypothetical protein
MSKPCLRLINCSGNAQPALSHKRRRKGFQLIQGGAIAKYPPITSDAFLLVDAHLHISYEYYWALLLAGLAVISSVAPRHIEPLPTDPLAVDLKKLIASNPDPSGVGVDGDPRESQ